MQKFMVGGAVRDKLMGMEPKDVDYVVVGSTPDEMLAAGFQQVGADFPVFLDSDGVEYALARTERKTGNGYHGFETDHDASVTLEDDLMRRDLTINAMAMDGDTLVDPFGGLNDLNNKVLRHVSDAFADDPVRVLRLARFRARFGPEWTVHPETMEFAKQMVARGELNHLTRERALTEMEKALGEPHAYYFFKTLHECGAMAVVYPELEFIHFHYDYALTEGKNCSAKFKYAMIGWHTPRIDEFESRMNVRIEWRKFAAMMRTFINERVNFSNTVDTLYALDAFRNHDLWEEFYQQLRLANVRSVDREPLNDAFNAVKGISFSNLTQEQQDTLKGSQISDAIRELRVTTWENWNAKA